METKNGSNFVRGDIFHIFLPTSDLSPEHTPPDPDIQLRGRHMCICLTDSTDTNVPSNLVGIVPISKATAAVQKGKLTMTHLPLEQRTFSFLDIDSYALVFQYRPIGRHWLEERNYVGNILDYDKEVMRKIAVLSLFVNGGYKDVMDYAYEKLKEDMFSQKDSQQ